MGFGTSFKPEIYLSRLIFSSLGELETKIEEQKKYLTTIKNRISIMVATDINMLIPDDWKEEPISWIEYQIREVFEQYEETLINVYRLELLKDNFETIEKEEE